MPLIQDPLNEKLCCALWHHDWSWSLHSSSQKQLIVIFYMPFQEGDMKHCTSCQRRGLLRACMLKPLWPHIVHPNMAWIWLPSCFSSACYMYSHLQWVVSSITLSPTVSSGLAACSLLVWWACEILAAKRQSFAPSTSPFTCSISSLAHVASSLLLTPQHQHWR